MTKDRTGVRQKKKDVAAYIHILLLVNNRTGQIIDIGKKDQSVQSVAK